MASPPVQWLQRTAWYARPPRGPAVPLRRHEVRGIAFHWPGVPRPIRPDRVAAAILGWQGHHVDDRGWNDIAYSHLVDQTGRVWCGRGVRVRSAANGATAANASHLAVCLIVAEDELVSPELVEATRRLVTYIRSEWPTAMQLVGHGDIRPTPTECPGPAIRSALRAGRLG